MITDDLAKENERLRRENGLLEDVVLKVEERLAFWRANYLSVAKKELLALSVNNCEDDDRV